MCSSTFDAGDLQVRFDERDVETELWHGYLGTARRKGRKTDQPNLRQPRHISTLPNRARGNQRVKWLPALRQGRPTLANEGLSRTSETGPNPAVQRRMRANCKRDLESADSSHAGHTCWCIKH